MGNSKYKTGEINFCVSFCEVGGMWTLDGGPGSGAPWGGQAGWPNQTVKKVYKLYCSTHTHTHTHTHARTHTCG